MFKRSLLFTLISALTVTASFFAGYFTHARFTPSQPLPVLHQAYDILLKNAYQVPEPGSKLEYGMIRGMLQAYGDPFSSFSEPPQAELTSNTLQGSFGGIGATIEKDPQGFYVLFPIKDSPAAKAGILDGDRLIQVDQLAILSETPIEDILAAVRGPVGTRVKIVVLRLPDETEYTFEIKREEIALPSVTWRLDLSEPRLGLIKVNVIASSTPDEIITAAAELSELGATAFVLDLRDNFGGLLDSGIDVARLFLKEGLVIQQQYRDKPVESFRVTKAGELADLPIVILINQNTASAAEIVAGALQGQKRAQLIGTPTYGKNTIQLVFELQDKSSLSVTAAQWWVPNLEIIKPGQGLQPDILLTETSGNPDPALQAAIQVFFSKP